MLLGEGDAPKFIPLLCRNLLRSRRICNSHSDAGMIFFSPKWKHETLLPVSLPSLAPEHKGDVCPHGDTHPSAP